MKTLTIELTEAQYAGLTYVAASPEEWVVNAATSRANVAVDEIIQLAVKHCLDNGISIPSTTEEIVALAFAENVVKTVVQRNVESTMTYSGGL